MNVTGGSMSSQQDWLAVEEPLELRLRYFDGMEMREQSIAITMRTPGDDLDLARGFLVGEGIVSDISAIQSIGHSGTQALKGEASNVVRAVLNSQVPVDITRLQRNFYTSSSCGVCGKASLEALEIVGAAPFENNAFTCSAETLHGLAENLASSQVLFRETGGLHAAALFGDSGEISIVREDVGRHNAMDKVVGSMLANAQVPGSQRGIFVSGRASFELMQKALMAGIPLLAAVGAPSSLAVDLAREYDITLLGFLRDGRFNIYHGADRINC
jgi:FdhD protein